MEHLGDSMNELSNFEQQKVHSGPNPPLPPKPLSAAQLTSSISQKALIKTRSTSEEPHIVPAKNTNVAHSEEKLRMDTKEAETMAISVKENVKKNKVSTYSDVKVTEEEAEKFMDGIYSREGHRKFVSITSGRMFGNLTLDNGQTLYSGERYAIQLYTTYHYLLINGTLTNDETSLKDWVKMRNRESYNFSTSSDEVKTPEFLKEAQSHVHDIVRLATSGLNKLPPYDGQIFRGDALTPEEIDKWRDGKTMIPGKFFSCCPHSFFPEKFARESAFSYTNDKNIQYKPVLYEFNSKNSKDISKFSEQSSENERIYPPGQAFRSISVDEDSKPGFAIIHLEEID